jgi:hypothetical protein
MKIKHFNKPQNENYNISYNHSNFKNKTSQV